MLSLNEIIESIQNSVTRVIGYEYTYDTKGDLNAFPYSMPSKSHIVYSYNTLPLLILCVTWKLYDLKGFQIAQEEMDSLNPNIIEEKYGIPFCRTLQLAEDIFHLYNLLLIALKNDCVDEAKELFTAIDKGLKIIKEANKKYKIEIDTKSFYNYLFFITLHEIGHIEFYHNKERRDKYIINEIQYIQDVIKSRAFYNNKNVELTLTSYLQGEYKETTEYFYKDKIFSGIPEEVLSAMSQVDDLSKKKAEEFSADDYAFDVLKDYLNNMGTSEKEKCFNDFIFISDLVNSFALYSHSIENPKPNIDALIEHMKGAKRYDVNKWDELEKFKSYRKDNLKKAYNTASVAHNIPNSNRELIFICGEIYCWKWNYSRNFGYMEDVVTRIQKGNLDVLDKQTKSFALEILSVMNDEILSLYK